MASATGVHWSAAAQAASRGGALAMPMHRPLAVPGVHGYCDQESIAAGETIHWHISSTEPYTLSILRLGNQIDDPRSDTLIHRFPPSPAQAHPVHPGSYLHVDKNLKRAFKALTLEAWVRPWKVTRMCGVLSQFNEPDECGFGVFINPALAVSFYLGDGAQYRGAAMHSTGPQRLMSATWNHIAAIWDGKFKSLWVNGKLAGNWRWQAKVHGGKAPLRLGAYGRNLFADGFLDGDLAWPVIYGRALGAGEIQQRFRQQALEPPRGPDLLGSWPLVEEQGSRVSDRSSFERHGEIINHGTWMIGGPSFRSEVPRYGPYSPAHDRQRGHGLRLASDDLYDCRWPEAHRFKMPGTARPGIYVGRLEYSVQGKPRVYDVTFIVRRARRRRAAPILVLTATNTWRAYSATPFANPEGHKSVWGTHGARNAPADLPAYCFYRGHTNGQGTYQLGLRMPWPAAGPYVLYGGKTDYSHLTRAERFTHSWLESSGYAFDVLTDYDLHRDPAVLRDYRVFIINGHSEYWSIPMYHGLEAYLAQGGNLICLSGNSLFWRVSYDETGRVLECRKVDAPGEQVPHARRGECWHGHDGLRGGLMRECGFPGWKLTGLETLGWNNHDDPDQFGAYVVDHPNHFLFQQPEKVGLRAGDRFGTGPQGELPRANGHEIDVRLSTLRQLQQQPAPPGTRLPADPAGLTRLANGTIPWSTGGAAFDYFFRPVKPASAQGGELIYWERPGGGRVFNAGSIGAGWALAVDEKFQVLLRNVLAHFGVTKAAG